VNITISGIHLKQDPKIKIYAQKKVEKLQKFHPKIEKIFVRLISKEAHRGQEKDYICEIDVVVPGHNLEIVDSEREMDKAIDKAYERMKILLIRNKEKHVSREHKKGILNKIRNRFGF